MSQTGSKSPQGGAGKQDTSRAKGRAGSRESRGRSRGESRSVLKELEKIRESPGEMVDGVFHPSEKMQAMLAAFLDWDGARLNIKEICRIAGINKATFYWWRRQPGFIEWFNRGRKSLTDGDIMLIDKVVHTKAKRGDLTASRQVYEKRGELLRRPDMDAPGGIRVETDMEAVMRLFDMLSKMLTRSSTNQPVGMELPL